MRIHILYLLLFFQFHLSAQCLLVPVKLESLVSQSNQIVEGEVVEIYSEWNENRTMIFTFSKIKVHRLLKGEKINYITLKTKGGIVNDTKIEVRPELQLQEGDKGVFILKKEKANYTPVAFSHSFFEYDYINGSANGVFERYSLNRDQLVNEIEDMTGLKVEKLTEENLLYFEEDSQLSRSITSFSPTTANAGSKIQLTINGSGFGTTQGNVFFRNSDNGGSNYAGAQSFEIISWNNTQIKVEIPTIAGTGNFFVQTSGGTNIFSSSNLTIPASQNTLFYNNSTFLTRHATTVSGLNKIVFTPNSAFNSNIDAKNAFLRAMKTWQCTNSINWELSNSTTSTSSAADDDINLVTFSSLGSGVLGLTTSYYQGCSAGSTFNWACTELDVQLSSSTTWNYSTANPTSSQYDFESVALHELGHALQLGHIIDVNKVMYFNIGNGATRRFPTPSEITMVQEIYNRSTSNTGLCPGFFKLNNYNNPNPVVNTTASSGAGSLAQAFIDVCPNDTINFSLPTSSTIIVSPELNINKNVLLLGLNQNTFALSGNNTNRIFNIPSNNTLSLQNLKLINSNNSTNGGAFVNSGVVNLRNVTFENNFQGSVRKAFSNINTGVTSIESSVVIKE